MKILTVVGARPQFIKAATVSRLIRDRHSDRIEEVIVHTGQHYDANMSQVFFDELDIPRPSYNLDISGGTHGVMTGRMIEAIEGVLLNEAPDWMLIYGDTNSTLAGALAAAKCHVPLAHVEAGLRSHNPYMPEEINRVLADRVSTLLLCPTQTAVDNLANEGFPFPAIRARSQRIENVGDVMYDSVLYYRDLARAGIGSSAWKLPDQAYALCTLHRQENCDDPKRLGEILDALDCIAANLPVVLPLHPRTRQRIAQQNIQHNPSRLRLVEPLPYLEMQRAQMGAKVILTDSGGVQKEAYFHQVPCVTLRDETEWIETVSMGWNRLVGARKEDIVRAVLEIERPANSDVQPYGDGNAASEIIEMLLDQPIC